MAHALVPHQPGEISHNLPWVLIAMAAALPIILTLLVLYFGYPH